MIAFNFRKNRNPYIYPSLCYPNTVTLSLFTSRVSLQTSRRRAALAMRPYRQYRPPSHDLVEQCAVEHDKHVQPRHEPDIEHDGQAGAEAHDVDDREEGAHVSGRAERAVRFAMTDCGAY